MNMFLINVVSYINIVKKKNKEFNYKKNELKLYCHTKAGDRVNCRLVFRYLAASVNCLGKGNISEFICVER